MPTNVDKLLIKTGEYLVKTQKEDGSWSDPKRKEMLPPIRSTDLILTAQNAQTLIMINKPEYVQNVKKALNFCARYSLEIQDGLELWSWGRLQPLKFVNIPLYEGKKTRTVKLLCNSEKNGKWITYPSTFNLTNYEIIHSLSGFKCKKTMENAAKWLRTNKAKDGKGWGPDDKSAESSPSFTSNVVHALILTGEDPTKPYLQEAKKFLESTQNSNGGWGSSKLTTTKLTTYATAIATLSLMLLSTDPFNKRVEKGINFILKRAARKGGWPLVSGETVESHTTFFSTYLLTFYDYLKEKLDSEEMRLLSESLKPQQVTALLFQQFQSHLKRRFERTLIKDLLHSKILGSTSRAVDRRKDIIKVLSEIGDRDIAGIIDELKKDSKYAYLNKKHHMTQIKSDVEFLRGLNLIGQIRNRYFIVNALA